MSDLTTTARAIIVASGPSGGLPGGARLLNALAYLLDRRLGRRTLFESHFHGPSSREVHDALDRWIASGGARMTIVRDGSRVDPIEASNVTVEPLVGHRGLEIPVPAAEVNAAAEVLGLAWAYGALPGTVSVAIAAKLAWIRELDPLSAAASLEDLATQLNWSEVRPNERLAGIGLARGLGY